MQSNRRGFCYICLNNIVTRFVTDDMSICQRCITDLIKFGKISKSGDWGVFTVKSIIDEYQYEIVESNYEYEIAKGSYSLERLPVPPLEPDPDDIMRQVKYEVRKSEGFLKGIYRSLFDMESRANDEASMFDSKFAIAKCSYDKKINMFIKDREIFINERDEFIKNRENYISDKMLCWIESIVYEKIEARELLCKRSAENVNTGEIISFGVAWIAKLLRAYHFSLIMRDDCIVDRLPEEERKNLNQSILKRDGYKCMICGETYKNRGLEVHHIIHLEHGGTHSHANLVTLCVVCHNKQHDYTISNKNNVRKVRRGGRFIAVDIETTGFSASDEIIEIAAILFEDSYPKRKFGGLVYTDKPIPYYASKVNGITNSMLIGKPLMSDVFPRFIEFVADIDIVVHNKSFDERFLRRYADEYGFVMNNRFIDTLAIARDKLPNLTSYKLGNLAFYFGMEGVNLHRAHDDALTAGIIYIELLNIKKRRITKKLKE
ncbi:3'-5' exonuclease [Thiothrix winogradskyi]|uniref:DNA-directed DNA polymerase n=1 Tax=Thiothrix winogradskyi TaxID=96472 RepID=A0ABY3T3P9_9GAMM|nr:3'-5' exonuclease [Thiothrix winogradskyi]UJS26239.1 HNH endonuclease [Thiothrix winogradskyi]